ncbi:MAG: DUF285 domain-containing protein [Candidatus Nanopelagicales bacterium]|nr:DUF285 domain-containing protein [Candidatus Nanopelagicales bacterium]
MVLAGALVAGVGGGFTAPQASAATSDFITTWNTSGNATVVLPLVDPDGGYDDVVDFSVDWGVGADAETPTNCRTSTVTSIGSSGAMSCTYTSTGSSTITVSGTILPGWNLSDDPTSKDLLTSVDQWGGFRFGRQLGAWYFVNASNLSTIGAPDSPDLTTVTNLSSMFGGNTRLSSIANANSWNMSNITEMPSMFVSARAFNQDISGWDTSRVTNMYAAFFNAPTFNQDISGWDTSRVTYMADMFGGATAMAADLRPWCVSLPPTSGNFNNAAPSLTLLPQWGDTLCAPSPPTLSSSASGVVDVSWTPRVAAAGTTPTGYAVGVGSSSSGPFTSVTTGTCASASTSTATSCTITGMTPGSTVYVQVTALNSVGTPSTSQGSSPRSVVVSSPSPPAPSPSGSGTTTGSGTSTSVPVTVPAVSVGDLPFVDPIPLAEPLASCQITDSTGAPASELNLTVTPLGGGPGSGCSHSPTGETGSLSVPAGSGITIGVDGFLPGSVTSAIMLSTPAVLGRVITPDSGRVEMSVLVPADASPGNHTLQITGYASPTQSRVVSVGFAVKAPSVAGKSILRLTYVKGVKLGRHKRSEVQGFASAHAPTNVGVTYSTKGSARGQALELRRARATMAYLATQPGIESVAIRGSAKVGRSVVAITAIGD